MTQFNTSKYTKLYFSLIEKFGNFSGAGEVHHIIPRKCGGTDDISNLVKVSCRVHFILHRLLPKMLIDAKHKNSMQYAFWRMCNSGKKKNTYRVTSAIYEDAKLKHRILMQLNNPKAVKSSIEKSLFTPFTVPCEYCAAGMNIEESKHRRKRFCNKSCRMKWQNAQMKNRTPEEKAEHNRKIGETRKEKGIKPWNAGKTYKHSDISDKPSGGKSGAEKHSKKVTGRKIAVREDGTRYWVYPNKEEVLVDSVPKSN